MENVDKFYVRLKYIMAMWNIYSHLWLFGIFIILVCCSKKNLATLET
jgi:hypothetical protein